MMRKHQSILGAAVLIAMVCAVSVPVPAAAQDTSGFRYVIPRFTSAAGSELLLTNLSNRIAIARVTLRDAAGEVEVVIPFQPGTHTRLTAAAFNRPSFDGTVDVESALPLSVLATVAGPGGLETIAPALGSNTLVVPFAGGTDGVMKLTLVNLEETTTTTVVITGFDPEGNSIGSVQRILPNLSKLSENVSGMFPPSPSGLPRDLSHIVIRTASNVFAGSRRVYAQSELSNYLNRNEGVVVPSADFGAIMAIPVSSAVSSGVIPFFAQGSDYVTLPHIINPTNSAASVTLTAVGPDGNVLAGTSPVTLQIPANGSIRRSVRNIFALPSGLFTGSLQFQSTVPVIVAEAIASESQGGFVVQPLVTGTGTAFGFSVRDANDEFFTGFTFLNPNSTPARITVRNISDIGEANSRVVVTVQPFASLTRSLAELLPEARKASVVHVSSDVPIVANALEGRFDNGSLSSLPAIETQPDYVPPDPIKFLVSGTVRHNGFPFSGVTLQLSGPINVATTTDRNGVYSFRDVPSGSYTLRILANGYTFSPGSRALTVANDSSRGNDFEATLITPTITRVLPPSVVAGNADTSIFVVGTPLTASTEIIFEGSPVVTSIATAAVPVIVAGATSGTETIVFQQTPALRTVLSAATIAVARVGSLFIRTNGPGGSASSEPVEFVIGSPAPVLSNMTGIPDPLLIGNPGFTLTVNGAGFTTATTLRVGNVALATTFVNATQLRAFVPPSLLGEGGILKVTAINPQPTVGPSNDLPVTLFNPIPGMTSISPNNIEVRLDVNSLPLPLTVNGFGFSKEAKVTVDGTEVPTEYRSSTQLVGSVPQSQLDTARIVVVAVKNPAPTLGTSEALPLSLYNLVPTMQSIEASPILWDPEPRFVGDELKFTAQVVIRGTNFTKSPTYVTGTPCIDKTGVFSGNRVSSTMAVGTITIACLGTYQLGVVNTQPGGGLSNILSFTVSQYTAPAAVSISGISPVAVVANSPDVAMTISGTNIASGAVVNFGTAVLFPVSVTSNSITVNIPSYLLRNSGIIPVSITNPNTTGNSNRILFTIN